MQQNDPRQRTGCLFMHERECCGELADPSHGLECLAGAGRMEALRALALNSRPGAGASGTL
jgi:hypothetical protein